MSLTSKTITGIIWNFTEQMGRRGIGLIITLLLARFLAPEDFGLVAMMAVFLAIGTSLMDSGFKQALIRKEKASQVDCNTAFFANLALGLFSYTLLFLVAPLIAQFYNEPRLISLVRVAGIAVMINAFQVVQSAMLSRDLNFKAHFHATMPAGISSGVIAVIMAAQGYGVWALIVQMLTGALMTTLLLWKMQGWRPTLAFSWGSLRNMYGFGYKLFLSGLLDTVFSNIYLVVIAKVFAAPIAGYYFFAIKIKEIVIQQLVGSIQDVTYPALATMQNDNDRLKARYRQVIQVTTFLLFPAMAFLAGLAEPLFKVLLPAKWLPAVSYLQLLCIAGLLYPLHSINLNILKVKGRSDLFLYLEIFKKIMLAVILIISYRYGVIAILAGQIFLSVLAYIPNSYFSSRLINYPIGEQIADFMPGLILAGTIGLAVYSVALLLQWPAILQLFMLGALAGLSYLVGAHILKLQAYVISRKLIIDKM
jgi:O-antigen/teichoic acid export membrane protein